jgi:hypothetical protein
VVVTCQGEQVANHRRSLVAHRTITDPVHAPARRLIKSQAAADRLTVNQQVAEPDLTIYDALSGGL